MKKKIRLEDLIEKEKELPEKIRRLIDEEGILEFVEIEKLEEIPDIEGYTKATIELMGRKYGVIMKEQLANALLDPSADDANIVREAGKKTYQTLKEAYGKKKLTPLESNFERTLFKTYLSSLLMKIVRYPTDQLNEETLEALGLKNENIAKLYASASIAWLGDDRGVENVVKTKGITSKLEKISYTGRAEKVDLSEERCHSGSHYVLKVNFNKKQEEVQINVPEIKQEYLEIENQIVEHIINNTDDPIIKNNARNFVRLYLNITSFYEAGKPLPLEWNK
jgi:hypothetical protein